MSVRLSLESVSSPLGVFHVIASPRGIRRVVLPGGDLEAGAREAGAPAVSALAPGGAARLPARQLAQYVRGERRVFEVFLDPAGSAFERAVWRAVARIPFGRVRTYGAIAADIGRPGAARAVGRANARNPIPVFVPCHRVVGAGDRLVGFGGGLALKARLLALEGVEVEGRIGPRARVLPGAGDA